MSVFNGVVRSKPYRRINPNAYHLSVNYLNVEQSILMKHKPNPSVTPSVAYARCVNHIAVLRFK